MPSGAETVTLAKFLLARIAEDEALAIRLCPGRNPEHGRWRENSLLLGVLADPLARKHIARHDPARVLADLAARRRIVELHSPEVPSGEWCRVCDVDHGGKWMPCIPEAFPCPTLRALASVYSDRPDFDPAWLA